MKNIFLGALAVATFSSQLSFAAADVEYYGSSSSESILEFEYFVETSAPANPQMAKILVDRQLTYLFGALSSQEIQAVPKANQNVEILNTEKLNNVYRIHYSYRGTIVISETNLRDYSFYLPRNPETAYENSLLGQGGVISHPCSTDQQHTEEQYFWYFWNPKLSLCPLKEGADYDQVKAMLNKKANTTKSFPEYANLIKSGKIRVDILMGMDDESQPHNPFQSQDIGAANYRDFHQQLIGKGFQAQAWSTAEIQKVAPQSRGSDIFVETLTKNMPNGVLEIRFFFGPISIYSGKAFHLFLKDGFENSSIMIYAGHSGLGEYLDLNKIESRNYFKVDFPQDRYQIYFFNGCSSYPYYNSMYFDRKGGTKYLDILTNGLATYFYAINPSSMALVDAVALYLQTGKKTSYQKIVDTADSQNLLGINGDEDNAN